MKYEKNHEKIVEKKGKKNQQIKHIIFFGTIKNDQYGIFYTLQNNHHPRAYKLQKNIFTCNTTNSDYSLP